MSAPQPAKAASVESAKDAGTLTLRVSGWLDAYTIPEVWQKSRSTMEGQPAEKVVLDASAVEYCDSAGLAMMLDLQHLGGTETRRVEIRGLAPEYQSLLELFDPGDCKELKHPPPQSSHLAEQVGEAAANLWADLKALVGFVGELTSALVWAARCPGKVRWSDALLVAENVGINALPIVALISFLIGLIMAFQSAVAMGKFGAEIYVADLVGLSMLRELGPLMTAIILAGRSGSAFAAELGTMKVNEEINALTTMGLDPVRFLVVTRVLAAVAMMPLLTVFSNLMGLVGGAVVFLSFDFPLITYVNQVRGAVAMNDLLGGLLKAFVFGILVAGIGCLRGLQTKSGASAVGLSTTRAVVSGIVLIVLADGLFSILYYYLGI